MTDLLEIEEPILTHPRRTGGAAAARAAAVLRAGLLLRAAGALLRRRRLRLQAGRAAAAPVQGVRARRGHAPPAAAALRAPRALRAPQVVPRYWSYVPCTRGR